MSKTTKVYDIKINAATANKSVGRLKQEAAATVGEMKNLSKASEEMGKSLNKNVNDVVKETGVRTKSLQAELEEMKQTMLSLDEGSKEFQELAYNAAQLEDAIGDVNARVRILASDTLRLDQTIGVINGLASAYGAMQGTMALLGIENESMLEVLTKLQAVQAITNGLTGVANMLNKDSAAGILLRDIRSKALITTLGLQTGATAGATVATRALSMAMNALPILAIVAGITAIVVGMRNMANQSKAAQEALSKLNESNLSNIKLQLFQLSNANDEFTESLNDLQIQVLDNQITEEEAEAKRKELYRNRLKDIEEEKRLAKIALGGRIFALEQQLGLETDLNETFDDKVVRLKETLYLQGEDNKALKSITAQLELYTNTLSTERQLKEQLATLNDNNNSKLQEEANKRREILFLIQQQMSINELQLLQQLNDEMQSSSYQRFNIIEQMHAKEAQIINDRYDYEVKQAQGNADQITLINLRRDNELLNNDKKYNKEKDDLIKEAQDKEAKETEDFLKMMEEMQLNTAKVVANRLNNEVVVDPVYLEFKARQEAFEEFKHQLDEIGTYSTMTFNLINEAFNSMFMSMDVELNNAAVRRDEYYARETEALQSQLGERLISQEEFDAKQAQLNDALAQQETNERRKAFAQEKNMRIGQATMSMLQGMLQAFSGAMQLGPIAGPIVGAVLSAAVGAMGASNIANIKKEQFRAARGGIVPGQPSSTDSVNALLAPGEMVINSKSSKMFAPTLSKINELGGGKQLVNNTFEPKQTSVLNRDNTEQRAYVVYSDIKDKDDTYNDLYESSRW